MSVGDCDGISVRTRVQRLRQSKIQHLHRPVVLHLHVGRLEVAVDDALLMRRFQRLGDLLRNRQRLIQRYRPLRDPVSERRAFNQLQHQRPRPLGLLDAVDGGDVRGG